MLKEVFSIEVLGNDIQQYFIALCMFLITYCCFHIFKYAVIVKVQKIVRKTETKLDDALLAMVDVHWPFFIFLSLFISIRFIVVSTIITKAFGYVMLVVFTYYIVRAITKLVDYTAHATMKKDTDAAAIDVTIMLAKGAIWVLAFVFILSNLGYNITTLLAGLGIGGIAIAFALQNVLSDIFASISIYIDKPFKPGDFIIVGDDMGTVKKIGIKSTRVTTLHGQELVMSNRELTETRVNNYGKMKRRRIVFDLGVTYQTPLPKMKKIPKMIQEVIDKTNQATFDRAHWKEYGESSLNIEIVYYVESPEYLLFRDIQQKINQDIMECFVKAKIKFAYPTRTIYRK